MIDRQCPFCKSTHLTKFQAYERMFGAGDSFSYLECLDCLSLQIEQIPDNLSDYYSGSYYSFVPLVPSSLISKAFKALRAKLFLQLRISFFAPKVYGYWLKNVFQGFNQSIADVGCGNGQLLYELHCSGFKNLTGFDPFLEKDQVLGKGLSLQKMDFLDSDQTFDLIMMHHSFEHMSNPESVLKACKERLNPGGTLLIRLPITDGQVWKDKRANWVQLDAPRHLVIPSISGLKALAKTQGLKLSYMEFDSTAFQFWGTALYEQGHSLEVDENEFFSSEEMSDFHKKASLYNQEGRGDQALFILKKAD